MEEKKRNKKKEKSNGYLRRTKTIVSRNGRKTMKAKSTS
jgi:hypothetical protein